MLQLLWEFIARLFLGLLVFCVIVAVGIIFVKSSENQTINPSACVYVDSATITLDGSKFNIPAIKRTTIWYRPEFKGPDRVEYAKPIIKKPWDEEAIGFCDQTIRDRSAPEIVVLKGKALEGLAQKLDLPSYETVDEIGFGTGTAGGFLVFKGQPAQHPNPTEFVLRHPTDKSLNWLHLQTRGWVDDSYRIAALCVPVHDSPNKSCSVRIHFKETGLSFEASSIRLTQQPLVDQPPPKEFVELANKLPKILDFFGAD